MEELQDDYAIGLDLGTTFSCIGVYRNGWVEIIPNRNGEKITPSIVVITENKILVGEETVDFLVKNYDSCIYEVKRLIGRQLDDKEKKKFQDRLPFQIVNSNKGNYPDIKINKNIKKTIYTPVEISSLIIKKMVSNAGKYLNKKISKLVITVPANFSDVQRTLTRQAAEALGLKVLRIINEPTAAAIAYGFDCNQKHKDNILIFDLGGGTFDISILRLQKNNDENKTNFEVIATKGDTVLGGEDFDEALINVVLRKIKNEEYENKIRKDKKAMKLLKISCENAKKLLSIYNETNIIINGILEGIDIVEKISREEFEIECEPLFERLIPPMKSALKDANLSRKEINEIILVGGSTRIPKIKKIIQNFFKGCDININDSINPDEAIAFGATIYAEKILHNRDNSIQNFSLLDITPFSLGTNILNKSENPEIQKEGDLMSVIIKRGTHIPVSKSSTYFTVSDNQKTMSINIYEGEKKYVKYNHLLKKSNINNLTKRPKGKTKVTVTFNVDVNGILNVEAKEESIDNTGQIFNLEIKNDEVILSKKEMETLKNEMKKLIEQVGDDSVDKNIEFINIKGILKNYKNSYEKAKKKIESKKNSKIVDNRFIFLKNYYNTLENFIDKIGYFADGVFMSFAQNFDKFDNETVLLKYFFYIKDLFLCYLEILISDLKINEEDKNHIFGKINHYLQIFTNKSSGYLNELLELLSDMEKNGKYITNFYQIIVKVIQALNKLGKDKIISGQNFCKYHSIIYFEQSNYYCNKYFPLTIDENTDDRQTRCTDTNIEPVRENMGFLPPEDIAKLEAEIKLCSEYLQNIKSGAILLCEEFLDKEQLITKDKIDIGSGFTKTRDRHNMNNLERMNLDNQKIFLHNYEQLLSSIQTSIPCSKKEAICIANILKIYSFISSSFGDKARYLLYLSNRCKKIVDHLGLNKEEDWYKQFNQLYEKLKPYEPPDLGYKELYDEMYKKHPKTFNDINDKFKDLPPKDFVKYIITNHPYKGIENDKHIDFDEYTPNLIKTLLEKYMPDNYRHSGDENSKKQFCIVHEISAKLNSLFS